MLGVPLFLLGQLEALGSLGFMQNTEYPKISQKLLLVKQRCQRRSFRANQIFPRGVHQRLWG